MTMRRPKLLHLCGSRSADALSNLIGRNGRVDCKADRDRYGRIVAVCHFNGLEINREMVRLGWAVDYVRYSNDLYLPKKKKRGHPNAGYGLGNSCCRGNGAKASAYSKQTGEASRSVPIRKYLQRR